MWFASVCSMRQIMPVKSGSSTIHFWRAIFTGKPDNSGMNTLQRIVTERLAELNRGPTVAEGIGGLGKNYITDIVAGKKTDIRSRYIDRIAKALDWTTAEFQAAIARSPAESQNEAKIDPQRSTVAAADYTLPKIDQFPQNIPVLGVANGAIAGAFSIDGVIDYVRRPPGLAHTMNAYSLYVVGSSMSPKYDPGDLVFVNPDRPPSIGDTVIIQTKRYSTDQIQAWIKILVRVGPEVVTVRQINPESTIDIKRETVVAIHRVLKMTELFGV